MIFRLFLTVSVPALQAAGKGDFDPGFFIKHYIKDMNIATEEGREAGADLSISEAVLAIYKDLEAKGLGDLGTQALLKHYLDV